MIIQIILVLMALIFVGVILNSRSSHSGKAWKKLSLILLAVVMATVVLFPDLTNQAARLVGVGRGADLLLYVTVVAFIGYALNAYLKQQDQRTILYTLARRQAVIEAVHKYRIIDR